MDWLKEKLGRACIVMACVWALVSAAAAAVLAQANDTVDTVLVLQERTREQTSLVSALRIQLPSTLAVRVRDWAGNGAGLPQRIQYASELASGSALLAVVWTEPTIELADGTRETVLYIVGQRAGRALLDVVRVPAGHGPDLNRALALKVGEVVNDLRQTSAPGAQPSLLSARAPSSTVPPTAAVAKAARAQPGTPTAAADRAALQPHKRWSAMAAVGGRLATQLEPGWSRWGVGCTAGPMLQIGSWAAALRIGLDWYPEASRVRNRETVGLSELTPLLLASADWRTTPNLALGVRSGAGLAFLTATGTTARGSSNEDKTNTFSWFVGVEAVQALSAGLAIAASIDMQVQAVQQRFAVNEHDVADLGRMRLVFGLQLLSQLR